MTHGRLQNKVAFITGAGSGIAILAFDNDFNEAVETILKSTYTATLGSSPILFNIRVKDADGNWGPVFKKTIFLFLDNVPRHQNMTDADGRVRLASNASNL